MRDNAAPAASFIKENTGGEGQKSHFEAVAEAVRDKAPPCQCHTDPLGKGQFAFGPGGRSKE